MTLNPGPMLNSFDCSLNPTDVHCWHVNIPGVATAHGLLTDVLQEDERRRAALYRDRRRRISFEYGRGLTRCLLEHYGVGPAAALAIRCTPEGKPEALHATADTTVHFNISHSGDVLLLAFARFGPVGVDVEIPRAMACDALARVVLSARELDRYAATPEAARCRLFLRAWTRKEALLKAIGTGIRSTLQHIDTLPWDATDASAAFIDGHVVSSQSHGGEYIAAIAHRLPQTTITAYRLAHRGGCMDAVRIDVLADGDV